MFSEHILLTYTNNSNITEHCSNSVLRSENSSKKKSNRSVVGGAACSKNKLMNKFNEVFFVVLFF